MIMLHAEEASSPRIVLVSNPVVGPYSWSLVHGELTERGWETLVSVDLRDPLGRQPCWQRTVGGVQAALDDVPDGQPIFLVGHSGAGPLLPPTAAAAVRLPISAYLFVHAGLSHPGTSRLDAIASKDAASAAELRAALDAGLRFPAWTDDDLRPIVPDPDRRSLLEELRPRGRGYWTEELPGISGWPNAPCGYLQFSAAYQSATENARRAGWPTRYLAAGHFHQLVDPSGVANALVELLAARGTQAPPRQTATIQKGATA